MKNQNRLLVVVVAVLIQLCLGVAYIWSVFQTGVANSIFGGDNAKASLTFSILLLTLSIGSIVGGKLSIKYSTKAVVIAGGILLSLGFFLASFVTSQAPWLLWLTYGVMGGVGMGFTYSTTIACAQKWYPEKKGLITGVIVSALGLGGVIFTPFVEKLVSKFGGQGVGEPKTFMVLSGIFLVVCSFGGFFLKNPPETSNSGAKAKTSTTTLKDYEPKQVLAMPQFYLLTATLMLACMGGLMMIGFAKPIAVAKGLASTATVGVLIISVFNSFGRLFWGTMSDKLGRENTVLLLLVGTGCSSLLLNLTTGYWIYALIAVIGFFYGGFLGVFPALTADLFGAKNMSTNYGMVLLGFGVGAVASSFISGHYKNIASQNIDLMFPAFVIAAVCAFVAAGFMLLLKNMQKKEAKA